MAAVFDTSQLEQLSADLGNAPVTAGPNIYKALTGTSAAIKRDWQHKLSGTPDVPFGPLTITYDLASTVTGPLGSFLRTLGIQAASTFGNQIRSDIGAEDGRKQAPIVTVLEFGSPVNNLPPHGYGSESLLDNQDDFANGLLIAIGDPLAVTPADRAAASAARDSYYLTPRTETTIADAGGVV